MLHRESGALVTRKLPTLKLYKIGVKLDMTGNTAADAKAEVLEHERPERREHMDGARARPTSRSRPSASCRRTSRSSSDPFAAYGELIGCDEDDACSTCSRSFKERKLMRRFAAVMNHRSRRASRPTRWACGRCPTTSSTRSARRWPGFALVSHCYRRPTYDDWPYSVFTMVHGKNARDCEATIAAIRDETGVDEYALLWSIKEYKKTRVRYFTDDWDDWRRRAPGRRQADRCA